MKAVVNQFIGTNNFALSLSLSLSLQQYKVAFKLHGFKNQCAKSFYMVYDKGVVNSKQNTNYFHRRKVNDSLY